MQNKSFLFVFLAICLATSFALADDNDATAILKFTAKAVKMEATYSGKYMTQCIASVVVPGVGKDVREFHVTYNTDMAATKGVYVFILRENNGGSIQELRVEETVVCSPEGGSVKREVRGGCYVEGALSIPPFHVVGGSQTQVLEMFGRLLISWAKNNQDLRACYRFENDLERLGAFSFVAEFAETPFEAYLAEK